MSSYRIILPGQTLSDDELQDFGLQSTYTPVLQATTTSPTMGTGSSMLGDYLLHQGFVTVGFTALFGTSGVAAGSGTYRLTLPSGLGIDADWQDNRATGQAFASDSSVGAGLGFYMFFIRASSGNPDTMVFQTTALASAATANSAAVTNAVPFTWAANDYIRGSFTYKTDFT